MGVSEEEKGWRVVAGGEGMEGELKEEEGRWRW